MPIQSGNSGALAKFGFANLLTKGADQFLGHLQRERDREIQFAREDERAATQLQNQKELIGFKDELANSAIREQRAEFMAQNPLAQQYLKGGGRFPKDERGSQNFSDYQQFMPIFEAADDNTKAELKAQRLDDPKNFRGRAQFLAEQRELAQKQEQIALQRKADEDEKTYLDRIAETSTAYSALETPASRENFKSGMYIVNEAVKTAEGAEVIEDVLEAQRLGKFDQDAMDSALESLGINSDDYGNVAIRGATEAINNFIASQATVQKQDASDRITNFGATTPQDFFENMVDKNSGKVSAPKGSLADVTFVDFTNPDGSVFRKALATYPVGNERIVMAFDPETDEVTYNVLGRDNKFASKNSALLTDDTVRSMFASSTPSKADDVRALSEETTSWLRRQVKKGGEVGERAKRALKFMVEKNLRPTDIKKVWTDDASSGGLIGGFDREALLKGKSTLKGRKDVGSSEKNAAIRSLKYGQLNLLPLMILDSARQ
jgi:hypothetical protein